MDNQKDKGSEQVRVRADEMENEFLRILTSHGFTGEKARLCATVFTENSIDGIYTHGVNRFPKFIEYVREKHIRVDEDITHVSGSGNVEQWNGNLGPGPLNALSATKTVMEIARTHGMGCVALSNTNHWMRGGSYGWKAAKAGFIFIGWSNTIANMPAWGASDSRLGNNPFVIAVPYRQEAVVLDMAMSQYSYGALELHKIRNQQLDVHGGFNSEGQLTKDPEGILQSHRVLPIGYWKGAGMSLLLDIVGAIISGGNSTHEITRNGPESALSQVFIAIDCSKLANYQGISSTVSQIINDYHASVPDKSDGKILYPGERVLITRKENTENGIPVAKQVWEQVRSL
jgi:3-dehydro-L-gulonate 2-dehydrogenase